MWRISHRENINLAWCFALVLPDMIALKYTKMMLAKNGRGLKLSRIAFLR